MKKIACLVVVLFAAVCMAACQPTPEKPIFVGKNYEDMLEKAKDYSDNQAGVSIKDSIKAPDTFVYDYSGNNMTISANVVLTIPEVSTVPILRVAPKDFSLNQALLFVDTFFSEAQELIQSRNDLTKSEMEAIVIELKQRKNLPDYSSQEDQEDIKAAIKHFTEHIPNAPDSIEKTSFDRSLQTRDITDGKGRVAGQYDFIEVWDAGSDIEHRLYLRNSDTLTDDMLIPDEGDGSIYSHRPTASMSFSAEGVNNIFGLYGAAVIESLTAIPQGGNLDKSPSDAKKEADSLLSSIGCGHFRLGGMMLINNSNKDKKEASQWTYELMYFPAYEGIGLAPIIDSADEEAFHAPLDYEKIKIRINDEGILSFSWDAPYEKKDIEVQNARLLPFEDIRSIFEKMMLVKYEPIAKVEHPKGPLEISITTAGLCYVLMRQQNAAENTLLVPVWSFYGYRNRDWLEENGINYGLYEQPILIINAIDGSIFDGSLGY